MQSIMDQKSENVMDRFSIQMIQLNPIQTNSILLNCFFRHQILLKFNVLLVFLFNYYFSLKKMKPTIMLKYYPDLPAYILLNYVRYVYVVSDGKKFQFFILDISKAIQKRIMVIFNFLRIKWRKYFATKKFILLISKSTNSQNYFQEF